MEITIESPHIAISSGLKNKIIARFSHIIAMYDRIVSCEVILKKKNDEQKNYLAEAKLIVPKDFLFAVEKAESFETALDKVTETIKEQLCRHKDKLRGAAYHFDLN